MSLKINFSVSYLIRFIRVHPQAETFKIFILKMLIISRLDIIFQLKNKSVPLILVGGLPATFKNCIYTIFGVIIFEHNYPPELNSCSPTV